MSNDEEQTIGMKDKEKAVEGSAESTAAHSLIDYQETASPQNSLGPSESLEPPTEESKNPLQSGESIEQQKMNVEIMAPKDDGAQSERCSASITPPHVDGKHEESSPNKAEIVSEEPDNLQAPIQPPVPNDSEQTAFPQGTLEDVSGKNEPDNKHSPELPKVDETVISEEDKDKKTDVSSVESLMQKLKEEIERDAKETEKEQEEIAEALRNENAWLELQKNLHLSIHKIEQDFKQTLNSFYRDGETFPHEIQDILASRKEGIQLCERMLKKLADRANEESIPEKTEGDHLPVLLNGEDLLQEILRDHPQSPKEQLGSILKSRRIQHNQLLADIKARAGKVEKKLFSTLERQVFPIIDGLEEGQKIGKSVIDDLIARFSELESQLKNWFAIYNKLIKIFEQEVETLRVRPLYIQLGDPIDYEFHEPFDVEEDPDMQDEQIKEVIRRGYVLCNAEGSVERILRASQVVVVKNPRRE